MEKGAYVQYHATMQTLVPIPWAQHDEISANAPRACALLYLNLRLSQGAQSVSDHLTDKSGARTVPHQMTTYLSRRNPTAWRFASYGLATLFAVSPMGPLTAIENASAQTSTPSTIGPRQANDASSSAYGMTDPVTSSLQGTEELGNRLREQQHRFQTNAHHRQLRPKRPEPGEVEVTREDDMMTLSDPLRNTLRSILPRDR
jgi:hypothetical protein